MKAASSAAASVASKKLSVLVAQPLSIFCVAGIVTMKAIVKIEETPDRPMVLHGVQHVLHPATQLEAWPDDDRRTRMVFIVRDLDPRIVRELFDAFLGYTSPDRPDAAKRLALALVDRTRILGSFPFSGRKVPEFDHPTIRELILRPYRIVYRVDEIRKIVGVARFWHGAQDALAADDL